MHCKACAHHREVVLQIDVKVDRGDQKSGGSVVLEIDGGRGGVEHGRDSRSQKVGPKRESLPHADTLRSRRFPFLPDSRDLVVRSRDVLDVAPRTALCGTANALIRKQIHTSRHRRPGPAGPGCARRDLADPGGRSPRHPAGPWPILPPRTRRARAGLRTEPRGPEPVRAAPTDGAAWQVWPGAGHSCVLTPAAGAWHNRHNLIDPEELCRAPHNGSADPSTLAADRLAKLLAGFREVRSATQVLCARLSAEDCALQSMPDASPAKWHLAHTSWFFETFVLEPRLAGYRHFDPSFRVLFNSYYVGVGKRHPGPSEAWSRAPVWSRCAHTGSTWTNPSSAGYIRAL